MWSKFEASSSEDETLGSSYYTNGLFKISNEKESTGNPRISAALQNSKILIAVDKSLILLEDENTVDSKYLSFSSEIDCFAVSRSGDLIVCCLADGNIHGVHIKGIPVFNLIVQEEDIGFSQSFVDVNLINDEFFMMCCNGKIYKLHNLDEKLLSEAIVTNDVDETCIFNESYLKFVQLDRISNTKLPVGIRSFCCIQTYGGQQFIISGSNHIFFVGDGTLERISYPATVKPIKKIYNLENYILGLTDTGEFVEICPYVKNIYPFKMSIVGDLQFIEDMRILESNEQYIELLLLSKPDARKERTMKIVDFPSQSVKSELTLPEIAWLVAQPKSSVNMYFVSGTANANGFIQVIEMKSITETDPEQRFKKLLLRGHFDEAETFAKQFDLDLEQLYQARAKKSLLDLHGIRTASTLFEEKFALLMTQLVAIQSKDYLVSLRLAEIPDRSCMTAFLEYILKNIETNKYQEETNEINELLLRLETLRLIDPEECNMEWQKFLYHRDMARMAMDYFKTDVLLSCLIWSRHSSSIMPKLQMEQFHKWLNTIPSTIEPFQLIQWLKHFAPCFLQTYPNEMTRLVGWCLDKTRALQFSNSWPEVGLEFINNINGIYTDVKFMFVDISRSYYFNMDKIQQLIFTLEEMVVLKKTYHLTMTLDDYSKGSFEETAFRLLQRIQIQNLKRLVNDFLYPIFMEHGGSPEETIVEYIHFLANNRNLGFWQERAAIAIEMLHNEENRLECALLVLKVSPVPWSEAVLPLAILGTTSSHPHANAIYIEYKTQSIKIIKVKYQWPVDYFDLQQDRMKLVFRILKVNGPDMIDDVKMLVKSSPDIATKAYFHFVDRLTELGRIDEVVELVQYIEKDLESSSSLFKSIVGAFIRKIDEELVNGRDSIENFVEVIKLLVHRLRGTLENHQNNIYADRVKSIKNIVRVRNEFKLNVSMKHLKSEQSRKRIFEEGIALLAIEIREKCTLSKMWSRMDLLVAAFNFSRILGLKLLCQKLDNLFITCHIVDLLTSMTDVVEQNEVENAFDLVVLLIVQQILHFENNLSSSNDIYDPLSFPLAYELLKKCLSCFHLKFHQGIMELIAWIQIALNYYGRNVIEATKKDRVLDSKIFVSKMTNGQHDELKRRDSYSIFDTVEEKIDVYQRQENENLSPVLRSICNTLKLLAICMKLETEPFERIKLWMKNHDSQQIKDDFYATLETLLTLKQHIPVFLITQSVMYHQSKAKAQTVLPAQFVSTVNRKMLKFILSQKDPNYEEAFLILRSEINRDACMEYLRSTLKNNSQRISFSTFSEMYSKYIGNESNVADERENRLKFFYYAEITKIDPSLRIRANLEDVGIDELLKDLRNRQLSVELVKKLSKDFGWDYQSALVQQIKIVLRRQDLEFEIKTDVFGKDEVVIKSSVEMIKKQCEPYLKEITNMDILCSKLMPFIKEINFYFFEMYLVVLELIEYSRELSMDQKIYRNMLLLLKHKLTGKRRPVGQFEQDYWMKSQPDGGVLPAISKYRLPFKPLIEELPESFLADELCVENFEKFVSLIQLHSTLCKVDVNDRIEIFGMSAVKNSILEQRAKYEAGSTGGWTMKPKNNAFLQSLLRMLTFLRDKSKRMAILYFNTTHSPEGCDQVEAAYECWKFALAHEAELSHNQKYIDLVEKIKRKYPIFKTQHLLHLYGLVDDRLMQLVENPTELIHTLYRHESIMQPQRKDINKLCAELAQLYDIDLFTIQVKLLQKWLAFTNIVGTDDQELNETLYEDYISSADNDCSDSSSDENVVRAHYILNSWSSSDAMNFLAGELSSGSTSTENQLQLYECFAKLIDDQNSSYMELINPKDYLLIKCCYYLKPLGLNLKPAKFQTMDKVDILKKIWTNHFNNAKALEAMSFICLGFDIHLPQIWNGVLKQMVALNMVPHLSILVEVLSTKSKLLHLASLKTAWECVIKEPFLHATKTQSYEQENKLAKSLIWLQKCPISTFLNLKGLAEQCMRLERPHMAAILMAFAKEEDRIQFSKMLEPFKKRGDLKKEILELEELGIAPVITKSATNLLKL